MRVIAATLSENGITPFHPDWVVPLQPIGWRSPLFVFPSSHSDRSMTSDAQIARLIAPDRPVWGIAQTEMHRALVQEAGVAALGAEYVTQVRALQPTGPYLLYGNCMGGYLAWETASQLLKLGVEIAEICFFEAPLRKDFANVRDGPMPVETTNVWRLGHHYAPTPLPVCLTHLMTPAWHETRWWRPWQDLALDGLEVVVLADDDIAPRAERLALALGAWCQRADVSRQA